MRHLFAALLLVATVDNASADDAAKKLVLGVTDALSTLSQTTDGSTLILQRFVKYKVGGFPVLGRLGTFYGDSSLYFIPCNATDRVKAAPENILATDKTCRAAGEKPFTMQVSLRAINAVTSPDTGFYSAAINAKSAQSIWSDEDYQRVLLAAKASTLPIGSWTAGSIKQADALTVESYVVGQQKFLTVELLPESPSPVDWSKAGYPNVKDISADVAGMRFSSFGLDGTFKE